jgi:dTDP-4-amino-4,6-dideoxygalactose transaminase
MHRRGFLATTAAAGAAQVGTAQPQAAPAKLLRAGYWGTQYYGPEEQRELAEVLETGRPFRWYGPGTEPPKKALTFEREFAARMGARFALGVTSGTAALQCAMAALEVGPGDEVILPAWTWHSCFNAVVLAGALPVFAEIDESFNIDPADLEKRITPQTKVILAVHLQGTPCDLAAVTGIARRHKVKVVEDCAQSVGASYKGRPVGSWGDVGIYSLQLNKTITAGEGGAVITNDPTLFERASRFHDLGSLRAPHQEMVGKAKLDAFVGTNFRMSEFTAGVLLAQVRKLDRIIAGARANAGRIREGVRDLPGFHPRLLHDAEGDIGAGVYFGFATKDKREAFLRAMRAEGVAASGPAGSVVLPVQPHIMAKRMVHPRWPSWETERGKSIQYGPASCPRTLDVLGRFGGINIDPKWTRKETDQVVAAVRKAYREVA